MSASGARHRPAQRGGQKHTQGQQDIRSEGQSNVPAAALDATSDLTPEKTRPSVASPAVVALFAMFALVVVVCWALRVHDQ